MTTLPPTQLAELTLPGGADNPRRPRPSADSAAARSRANRFEHVLRSTSGSHRADTRSEPSRVGDRGRGPTRNETTRRAEQRRRDPAERLERPQRERATSEASVDEEPVAGERLDEKRGDGRDGPSPRSSSSDDDRLATSTDPARNEAEDVTDDGSSPPAVAVDEDRENLPVDGDLWSSTDSDEPEPTVNGLEEETSTTAQDESTAARSTGASTVSATDIEPTLDATAPVTVTDPAAVVAGRALDPTAAVLDPNAPELHSEAAAESVAPNPRSPEATAGAAPVTAGATDSSVGSVAGPSEPVGDRRVPSGSTGHEVSSDSTRSVGSAGPETGSSGDTTSSEQAAESKLVIESSADRSAEGQAKPPIGAQQGVVAPSGLDQHATSAIGGAEVRSGTVGTAGLSSNATSAAVARTEAPAGTTAAGSADGQDAGDPVWRQVRRALGSIRTTPAGEQQLTIRLRPAELGSVMVRISTGENGTTVALVADSSAAANQLQQQRSLLVSELEESGLRGIAVDVGTSGDARNQAGNLNAGRENNSSATGRLATETDQGPDADPNRTSNHRDRRVRTRSSGLVDLDL